MRRICSYCWSGAMQAAPGLTISQSPNPLAVQKLGAARIVIWVRRLLRLLGLISQPLLLIQGEGLLEPAERAPLLLQPPCARRILIHRRDTAQHAHAHGRGGVALVKVLRVEAAGRVRSLLERRVRTRLHWSEVLLVRVRRGNNAREHRRREVCHDGRVAGSALDPATSSICTMVQARGNERLIILEFMRRCKDGLLQLRRVVRWHVYRLWRGGLQ